MGVRWKTGTWSKTVLWEVLTPYFEKKKLQGV
jgi:hypothetical protein